MLPAPGKSVRSLENTALGRSFRILTTLQPLSKSFLLNTGHFIPVVGLGTWQSKPQEVYHAMMWALAHGYRHIGTAFGYGNEKEVGVVTRARIPREEI
jgi:glycerol 2-dehydrogenase (NADP+)